MSEYSPTSEIHPDILNKVTRKRNIAGFSVEQISKTGSSFHILGNGEKKGIVRNGEVPASSMAVWEFLYTHAETIFPENVTRRLFGPWDKPQVAPILERKGKNRVYYSEKKATAYSQMVGFDTQQLTELWQLSDEVYPYYFQNSHLRESRWLDCTSYHLAKDVFAELPTLDPNNEAIALLEGYWKEFARLNQNLYMMYSDLLQKKELRRQDMDKDDSYQSSLKLVETGHEIAEKLIEIYHNLEESGQVLLWKGKPAKNVVLLLTHLYQTSAQQSVMWWLGVAHGHLHSFNAVSRIPTPDSPEAQISPLVTSIIDFDASRVSVDKLALNDELFASVNGEAVKSKVKDQNLNQNVRLQLAFYLPLEQWDDEIVQFVQNSDSKVKGKLVRLVSLRAGKDVHTPERYTWFADFVYEMEKQNPTEDYPAFCLTLRMLHEQPDFISPNDEGLSFVANYYKTGEFPATDQAQLTQDQRVLLLSAIYQRYRGTDRYQELGLSIDELQFVVSQLKNKDITAQHAGQVLAMMIKDSKGKAMPKLFEAAQKGERQQGQLAREIINFLFSQNTAKDQMTQSGLIMNLAKADGIGFAIGLMDFRSLPKDQAISAYRNMCRKIESCNDLSKKPQDKAQLLVQIDQQAKAVVGRLVVLKEKVRRIKR